MRVFAPLPVIWLALVVLVAAYLGEQCAKRAGKESSSLDRPSTSVANSKEAPRIFRDLKVGEVLWVRRERFLNDGLEFQSWMFLRNPKPVAILSDFLPTDPVLPDWWSARTETQAGEVELAESDLEGLDLYLAAHSEGNEVLGGERERLGVLRIGDPEPLYFDIPLVHTPPPYDFPEPLLLTPRLKRGMVPFSWLEEAIRGEVVDFHGTLRFKETFETPYAEARKVPSPPKADTLFLFEGLPHPLWEHEVFLRERASKPNFNIGAQAFYQGELEVSQDVLSLMVAALGTDGALRPRFGSKLCGGFHADFGLVWKKGTEIEFFYLICYGCHEVRVGRIGDWLDTDVSPEAFAVVQKLTTSLRRQRPVPTERELRIGHQAPKFPAPGLLRARFLSSDYDTRPQVPEVSLVLGRSHFLPPEAPRAKVRP